jgi:hypothetical protein
MSVAAPTRHRKALALNHKVAGALCVAGLGVGAFLGIPPFVAFTESLIGTPVSLLSEMLSDTPILANVGKVLLASAVAIAGYNCYTSSLKRFHKFIGLVVCGTVLYSLYEISPAALASGIISLACPLIGTIFWAGINATQIYVWALKNDPDALQRMFGFLRPQKEVARKEGETDGEFTVRQLVGANKVAIAFSSWMNAGLISYVLETGINFYYSKFFSGIPWADIFQPGVLAAVAGQLIWGGFLLFLSVRLIEFCLIKLDQLETLKEVVES